MNSGYIKKYYVEENRTTYYFVEYAASSPYQYEIGQEYVRSTNVLGVDFFIRGVVQTKGKEKGFDFDPDGYYYKIYKLSKVLDGINN